jgi:hypothetical protein
VGQGREHRLNTIKRRAEVQNENRVNSIARKRPTRTPCSLLSIESRLPKLDVVGSNPISRSNIFNGFQRFRNKINSMKTE